MDSHCQVVCKGRCRIISLFLVRSLIMKIFLSILAVLCFTVLYHVEILRPDPFSEEYIAHDVEGGFLNSDLSDFESIFSQPFKYLGRGQQSVAFLSKDKKYVLKFFLKKVPQFRTKIVSPFSKNKSRRKFRIRLDKALKSYEIAFQELKAETALIGVHLNAGGIHFPLCKIRDWAGLEHQVDLNRASFVLQYYCDVLAEKYSQMNQEDVFSRLRMFFEERTRKGYTDLKRRFNSKNFGFYEGKAVMIDPGNLEYVEELKASPEIEVERIMKFARRRLEELPR